ncbi:MAG: 1,4-alpha-glucan branching protein GlgB [Ruminococcaceae bacterium]|nr:1,4-alpha-glucan branching protein GlgB [Oscillospiraceae bacterium]
MANSKKKTSSYDRYLGLEAFTDGHSTRAWTWFGAHPHTQDGQEGFYFRVWAPNAVQISVFGPFNDWDACAHPLSRVEGGIWEGFIPGLSHGMAYQYAVWSADDHYVGKADPYAFCAQLRPDTASVLYDLSGYSWGDKAWLSYRKKNPPYNRPMNIYEVHLGSWRRTGEGGFLSYRDIAQYLVPYVKEMGYTHVEFLPVMEHPLDMSWGYQCTGYFAATSRFGTPHDLKYLIDQLHQAGVGVILDWVPAHFPRDAFGLYHFDGTPTYEYADPRKGEHPEWGTNCFDLGRSEVRSFLFSSAMFWLEEYHADGLRVDAVSSMLYLDYARQDGQWMANVHGGHENLEAVDFLQKLNTAVFAEHPDVLMIAEEATSWPKVTHPVDQGGLGFNFKWNMGWMNDVCHYLKTDPIFRQYSHRDLTFSLMYAFSENYILPISHDEVVHMKGSLIGKMPGWDGQKYGFVRGFWSYMLTHPGKKLLIMGSEIGQFNEWHYEHSLDWHLLDYEPHRTLQSFFKEANGFYLAHPALWEQDNSWQGFEWLEADDAQSNVLAYLRRARDGSFLLVACNFSPVHRPGYRLGVPVPGTYRQAFNSEWHRFGGCVPEEETPLLSQDIPWHRQGQSIQIDIPPTGCVICELLPSKPGRAVKKKTSR